jgi:hypothetical protein
MALPGCAGTPQRVAYQGLTTSRITVETALGLYNVWLGDQKAKGTPVSLSSQAAVKAAFDKWKAAQLIALQAGRLATVSTSTNAAGDTGLVAAFDDAVNNLSVLRIEFLSLLSQLGVTIPGVTPAVPTATTFTPVKL